MAKGKKARIILHVITDLDMGGAEMMLYRLLRYSTGCDLEEDIKSIVLTLSKPGSVGDLISSLDVPVYGLDLHPGRIPSLKNIFGFVAKIHEIKPTVIQGWMYHGNLAATIASMMLWPRPVLFWNIRQTMPELRKERKLTRTIVWLSSKLSRLPNKVIYNAIDSIKHHEAVGFSKGKELFIPNGFDLPVLTDKNFQRDHFRRVLGVDSNTILLGHIARFHPKKDQITFLCALVLLLEEMSDVHTLIVGRGTDKKEAGLTDYVELMGIQDRVHFLGESDEIQRIYKALDIVVSSSAWGEGFSNSIGEAMSHGVPCVTTDVGESRRLVGDSGLVVPPGDSIKLAGALSRILSGHPYRTAQLGKAARKRIKKDYSMKNIARRYHDLY